MKKILLGLALVVLAVLSQSARAQPETGYWWNPAEGGRGFVIEIQGTTMYFAGFLYAASGEATWVSSSGPMSTPTSYSGSLITYSGGQTLTGAYQSAQASSVSPGTVAINFASDTTASLTWPGGAIPIQRFDIVPGGSSATQPAGNPQTGYWWNPAEAGRGFTLEVQNGTMYLAGFMYDAAGNPLWYLASGNMSSATLFQGTWTQYGNGQTLTGSYQPASVVNSNVGAVTLQFASTTSATLTLPDGRQIPFERFVFGNSVGPQAAGWMGFARDPQHSAQSAVASQPLDRIIWQTSIDLAPQYSSGELLIHYGSPVMTPANTVLVPVKTTAQGGFRINALAGASGNMLWYAQSDYVLPPQSPAYQTWTPSFNPALTTTNRVYFAGLGGKLYYRDNADYASGTVNTLVFYGADNYNANSAAYNATIFINTPITTDAQGNVYFGFFVSGTNPIGLQSGIARIDTNGNGSWVSAASLAADSNISKLATGSAPALSVAGDTLYFAVNSAPSGNSYSGQFQYGYLVAVDSSTLAFKARQELADPRIANSLAYVSDDSSASPAVGPDGDVYFGVLEANLGTHNYRGWMLHFDSTLSIIKIPGSFGWDDTASIVPASMVPSYTGKSSYLIATKYNNYAGAGTGNGQNRVAVLDPNGIESDPISGNSVMDEVLTVLGVTADPDYPGGVREWCINSIAVDPFTKSIMVNSEDGFLYHWDMTTNQLTQRIQITAGLGEAYTPTMIGPDGTVYAINNATLFAVGQ